MTKRMLPTADAAPATEKCLDRLTQVWHCPHCERPEDQLPVRDGRFWGLVPDARGQSQRVCLDCVDAFDASVRVQKFCEAPLDGPIH